MCFHIRLNHSINEIEQKFQATFDEDIQFDPHNFNAFSYPDTPVIFHNNPSVISLCKWGLIPKWAKNSDIRKYTLNAKIETLYEKPSFKNVVNNRCLVIVDGFYEWKWLDNQGKQKQKYLITLKNEPLFSLAGLWSEWIDKKSGEIIKTYTIVTTQANNLMAEIHNNKKRMPVVLTKEKQKDWLNLKPITDFAYPHYNTELQAVAV